MIDHRAIFSDLDGWNEAWMRYRECHRALFLRARSIARMRRHRIAIGSSYDAERAAELGADLLTDDDLDEAGEAIDHLMQATRAHSENEAVVALVDAIYKRMYASAHRVGDIAWIDAVNRSKCPWSTN